MGGRETDDDDTRERHRHTQAHIDVTRHSRYSSTAAIPLPGKSPNPARPRILPYIFPCPVFRFGATAHSTELSGGNHVGEGGLWRLGDARRSRRVDLDGGGRARGAVAGRRQPPSASRRPFAKAGGVIGCCSQAAADKHEQHTCASRRRPGGRRRCHLNPLSAPLHADCGVCCVMPTHQTLARA